jgi:hypothetical protein
MCDFFYFAGEGDQGEDKNDALICSITLKFIPIAWEEQGVLPSIALVVRKEARRSLIRPLHKPRSPR